jgi:hypothetical protein
MILLLKRRVLALNTLSDCPTINLVPRVFPFVEKISWLMLVTAKNEQISN